jgi:predicted transcriptional regulator of viral defense system
MDYKFFGLSESEPSRVFLNVPEPEKFMNGMYFKVSELPLGWKVFVKKHSGEFDEIQNLVHNN